MAARRGGSAFQVTFGHWGSPLGDARGRRLKWQHRRTDLTVWPRPVALSRPVGPITKVPHEMMRHGTEP